MVTPPANGRVLHIEVFRGTIYFHQRQLAQDTILNFDTNAVVISSVHVGMGQKTLFNDFVIMHHSLQPGRWLILVSLCNLVCQSLSYICDQCLLNSLQASMNVVSTTEIVVEILSAWSEME